MGFLVQTSDRTAAENTLKQLDASIKQAVVFTALALRVLLLAIASN
jgi:hypothetical protein